jgi:predicted Zn-dependent protease
LAASEFLTKLRDHSQLQAKLAGRAPETVDKFDIGATHPRTAERTERAITAANAVAVTDAYVGQAEHLAIIDGIIYGGSADEGFIDGQRFSHRDLQFEFSVPNGFVLTNQPARVIARSERENATIIFDQAPDAFTGDMKAYLNQKWISNIGVNDLETIFINSMEASTGWIRQQSTRRATVARFVAIRFAPRIIFRFVLLTPSPSPTGLTEALKRATYGFRRLTEEEAAALAERRVRVVRVSIGKTVEALAKRMAYSNFQRERFEVLNGLSNGRQIFVGESVKIISR